MKVALCISGFMRCFDNIFHSLNMHLISKYHPDVFIHTWYKEHEDYTDTNRIIRTYNPKAITLEPPRDFPISEMMIRNNKDDRPLNNIYSMFYSIKQCNNLKSMYERDNRMTYDCVIRLRPDIRLRASLQIDESKLHTLMVPMYGDYQGLNDQFAWSNSHNMNIYSSLFDHLDHYDMYVRPEFFMKHHVKLNNLTINRTYIPYVLDRCGSIIDNQIIDGAPWEG